MKLWNGDLLISDINYHLITGINFSSYKVQRKGKKRLVGPHYAGHRHATSNNNFQDFFKHKFPSAVNMSRILYPPLAYYGGK